MPLGKNNTERKAILQWLEYAIEEAVIRDKMTPYAPNVEIAISLSMDDKSIPAEIRKLVSAKYFTKDEDGS